MMCILAGPYLDPPPEQEWPCCYTAADERGCTCWVERVSHKNKKPREGPNQIRWQRCSDCAYRRDSPERQELDGDRLSYSLEDRFYCHDGMARVIERTHPPTGVVQPAEPGEYVPIRRHGRTFRADGQPAYLCAGWAAENGVKL